MLSSLDGRCGAGWPEGNLRAGPRGRPQSARAAIDRRPLGSAQDTIRPTAGLRAAALPLRHGGRIRRRHFGRGAQRHGRAGGRGAHFARRAHHPLPPGAGLGRFRPVRRRRLAAGRLHGDRHLRFHRCLRRRTRSHSRRRDPESAAGGWEIAASRFRSAVGRARRSEPDAESVRDHARPAGRKHRRQRSLRVSRQHQPEQLRHARAE
jgi:hypothetical protein